MKKLIIYGMMIMTISACNSEKKAESVAREVLSTPIGNVSFSAPLEGQSVSSPVRIVMLVEGMEVEPAGMVNHGKGHHHLIIDGNYIEEGVVVPADSTHMHFGKGQTEVEIALTPGNHTLTLQFADGVHTSYGKSWSSTVAVTVEAPM